MDPLLLQQIRDRLAVALGPRFCNVILYGSQARGEATPESDIDVLVLLSGPIHLASDLETAIHALYPLSIEIGRPISPYVATPEQYRSLDCPLFQNVRREGVPA